MLAHSGQIVDRRSSISHARVAGSGSACYDLAKRSHMGTREILAELEAEKDRLDRAIAALGGSAGSGRRLARVFRANGTRRPRRRLSAASKNRISAAMKKAWARRKKKAT